MSMWQAALTNHDLFFTLKIWKLNNSSEGTFTVGFTYCNGIDASNSFLWLGLSILLLQSELRSWVSKVIISD